MCQARRFREVAEGLGGLIIKLSQYLSIRIDMLPREYTEELSALQDSVCILQFFRCDVPQSVGVPFHKSSVCACMWNRCGRGA